MTPLDVYRQQVRDAILARNGEAVLNGNVDHATIITQEAFNFAKSKIRILSYKLDASCYANPGVLSSAQIFLADPEHRAEILIEASLWDTGENFEWSKHPLVAALKEFGDRAEIRLVPKSWAERYKFNFLLLDDYGFRFEADRARPAAAAAFLKEGETGQVKKLDEIFSTLWGVSAIPVH